jgi:hypothetical protein
VTLRDPNVSKLLNRHFVPVVVDVDKPPPEVSALFQKVNGQTLPFLIYVSDRGQFLNGTSGLRSAADLKADLEKSLGDKQYTITKTGDAELNKQLTALEKALTDKTYTKVPAIWTAIGKVRGYGPAKDKAYDLMEEAESDGRKELAAALGEAKTGEFAAAKKRVAGVTKDLAGLPVADEAKLHLAALTTLENVQKLSTDMKGNWKLTASQQLDNLLRLQADTPYAALATQRKKDLQGK